MAEFKIESLMGTHKGTRILHLSGPFTVQSV